jgi:nitroreductase / dihydropteridine reductase
MKTSTEALNWRYATKKFDTTKQVPDTDLQVILDAGRLAPTAYGLQPFRVIRVIDAAIRTQLRTVSYDQAQVTDASVLLVLAIRTDMDAAYVDSYIANVAMTRGMTTDMLQGYADMMKGFISRRDDASLRAWSARQSYIALGTMLQTAAELGVDGCPMEGFDTVALDGVLGLAEHNLTSVAYLTLGYRSEADETATWPKVRLAMNDFVIEK